MNSDLEKQKEVKRLIKCIEIYHKENKEMDLHYIETCLRCAWADGAKTATHEMVDNYLKTI